jgi:hypothetical protein
MSADTTAGHEPTQSTADYEEHVRTYKGFVRATMIFVAHCVALLVLMAIFLV